jgi:hypothetical protein
MRRRATENNTTSDKMAAPTPIPEPSPEVVDLVACIINDFAAYEPV